MLFSIQFLRFIAAFGVVLHHSISDLGSRISVFAAGVDIFFVISGFVISYSTKQDEEIIEFATKRFIRVFPIYWIATLFYIFFKYLFWADLPHIEDFVRSMLLIPVLGTHWLPIYFLGWTLVFECAFYTLFGLMILLAGRHARLACIVILSCLASMNIYVPWNGNMLMTDILLEFVFGLLIAESLEFVRRIPLETSALIAISALSLFAVNYGGRAMPIRPVAWGIPAGLLLAALIPFDDIWLFQTLLAKRLGAASYAIYLTHMTIIQMIEESLKRHGFFIKTWPTLATLTFVSTSSIVGVLVNIYIEQPLLKFLRYRFASLLKTQRSSSNKHNSV